MEYPIEKLRRDLRIGVYDEFLDDIQALIKLRRKQVADNFVQDLKIGDTVVINSGVSPKYLAGAKAEVVGFNKTRLQVSLFEDVGKFRAGRTITCPPSILVLSK